MIDTKALRSKVLDLAIQGKLTEQLESDGNVETILKAINPKKDISQTVNTPFQIPNTWKWVKLCDLYKINPPVVADNSVDSAFIPMEKVSAGFDYDFSYDIQSWGIASKNHTKFQNGDVAFAKISPCFENRKSFIAENLPNGIGGGTTELIILRQNEMYSKYTYLLVIDQRFITAGSSSYKGVVGQQRVKSDVVKNYYVPVPPLAEQKRIVERVEEIFKLLDIIDEAQKKYSADAEILKSKLITMGIQGKLTKQLDSDGTAEELFEQIQNEKQKLIKEKKIPKEQKLPSISKEEISFNIPCNWKWVRVQDIATYITDYVANGSFATLKAHTKTYKEPNYALFVRTMDLSCNFSETCSYIDKESYDFLSKSQLFGGELILPNIGASIGKAFIMPNLNMPMSLAPNSILLKFTDTSMNKYFSYIVKSSFGQNLLTKSQGGSATAKFSKTDLRKLVVPLPPLAEQKRIADTLDEVLRVIG